MSKKGVDISGSLSYNRLDFQISQAMLLVVEWYACEDFTIVMDFYEDIAVFEGKNGPVSFFQIKTSEEPITIGKILSQQWLHELCSYLVTHANRVKEISLVTSSPIKLQKGSLRKLEKDCAVKLLNAEQMSNFLAAIEKAYGVPKEQIEEKLTYRCTKLGVRNHERFAQSKFVDLLQSQYESIEVKLAKSIAVTIRAALQRAQKEESIDASTPEETALKLKGVEKKFIKTIIENSVFVEPLEEEDIKKFAPPELHDKLYKPLFQLITDQRKNSSYYKYAYHKLKEIVRKNTVDPNETIWQYSLRCVQVAYATDQSFATYVRSSVEYYAELLAMNIYLAFMKL